MVEFWKNLYGSETDKRDYLDVVQEAFTAAKDEGDFEITLNNVQAAVKYTRNWIASGRDTVYNFWLKYLTSSHVDLARQFTAVL